MKQILIIDDAVFIRTILEQFLNTKYEVVAKNDGLEALTWLQQGNIPDLIVADIKMPNLDGYELVKQLKASGYFKNIPVIMLSSIEDSAERVKFLKLGADDFMIKPFNPEELELKIEIILSRINA
jgi:DNA-binding response OmpR family regulator